jgi:hypothetical protein
MAGACPGHLDAEGTAFQQNTLGVARALLIEITGTSPVMTSVGAIVIRHLFRRALHLHSFPLAGISRFRSYMRGTVDR